MSKIVILGAGAIGRGFLPWVFTPDSYEYVFVDINRGLINSLNRKKQYKSYRVKSDKLEELVIPVKKAYHLSELSFLKHRDAIAVFMNVGPRNCTAAANALEGVECPVILCENDPETVAAVKDVLNYEKIYFAIPDVITSNAASPEILAKEPLSIITEDGTLFMDERVRDIKGNAVYCDAAELDKQWIAKLFLHNTPHCIAAYLGALVGARYIHEAMQLPEVKKIVTGAMNEMLTSLKLKWDIPHPFLDYYAEKEIRRFSCELLYDPISRVAREPLRKLQLEGRLIGAAQICLSLGFIPNNILIGIATALLFENKEDLDHHLSFIRNALPEDVFITYILGLRKGEALEIAIRERLPKILSQLGVLTSNSKKVVL